MVLVEAVRGCRSHGAGSEARYLLRWHFFSMHRQYDAILQSDLDLVLTALFSVMMMFHFTHLDAIKGLSQSLSHYNNM